MPQALPFFFVNQFFFAFTTLIVLVFLLSKFILPLFTSTNVNRLYITKL